MSSREQIFDPYRKKYVARTPEEEVRQFILKYLTDDLHIPASLTAVETLVKINNLSQRADIVIYDKNLHPLLIVECKAPTVKITKATFEQALRYNTVLGTRFVVVTNGITHYCAEITTDGIKMLNQIPDFSTLQS